MLIANYTSYYTTSLCDEWVRKHYSIHSTTHEANAARFMGNIQDEVYTALVRAENLIDDCEPF